MDESVKCLCLCRGENMKIYCNFDKIAQKCATHTQIQVKKENDSFDQNKNKRKPGIENYI